MNCPIEHLVDRRPKNPVKVKKPKQENRKDGEKIEKPKKAKQRLTVHSHFKLILEEVKKLGYELHTIIVNNKYRVHRANITGKVLLK